MYLADAVAVQLHRARGRFGGFLGGFCAGLLRRRRTFDRCLVIAGLDGGFFVRINGFAAHLCGFGGSLIRGLLNLRHHLVIFGGRDGARLKCGLRLGGNARKIGLV